MVNGVEGSGRKLQDYGFRDEPPPTVKTPVRGWHNGPPPDVERTHATSLPLLDLSLFAKAGLTRTATSAYPEITGSNRTFDTSSALGPEIERLKAVLGTVGNDDSLRAAIRQELVMRQAEWVSKASAEGSKPPTGALDPLHSTPAEVTNAVRWMVLGGVIPRAELAHDGGASFTTSVRDAVVLRTRGFDALLALHANEPERQCAFLRDELGRRGVSTDPGASLDSLDAQYAQSLRNEETERPTIGLDGRSGTAEQVDRYERHEAVAAMNPGTTLGSMAATYSAIATGGIDIESMRSFGELGNALEAIGGGAGVHLQNVAHEGEPIGTVKPDLDNFNRTGLPPRFRVKAMNPRFEGENQPGNEVWNRGAPTKPFAVQYATRPTDRAPYRLEVRAVVVNGQKEMRIVDAHGAPFDTRNAEAHDGRPCAIFVMNAQGEIFASPFQERAVLHHSSLAGGEPVAAAGEMVVEDGKLISITNRSGHYRPDAAMTNQALTSLREKGLDVDGVKVIAEGMP